MESGGRRMDGGRAAASPMGRVALAGPPWMRHLRAWLDWLGYRPERRYMRGARPGAARPASAGRSSQM